MKKGYIFLIIIFIIAVIISTFNIANKKTSAEVYLKNEEIYEQVKFIQPKGINRIEIVYYDEPYRYVYKLRDEKLIFQYIKSNQLFKTKEDIDKSILKYTFE